MAKIHSSTYKVVAYSRDSLRGTYNSIIASGRTKIKAIKEYSAHMERFPVSAPANYKAVFLYKDDVQIETLAR